MNKCLPADFMEQALGELQECYCTESDTVELLSIKRYPQASINKSLYFSLFLLSLFTFPH